ncbi:MAG TPA: hypothetical protein VKB26_03670 [Candidatus Acidoferrales bacterium]|nr:hypothetical protein [Candidatus Acidoferrales bacterium]
MLRITSLAAALLLLTSTDFPRARLLPPESAAQLDAAFSSVSSTPDIFVAAGQSSKAKPGTPQAKAQLAIIRYVDEEYARVVQPLPLQKQGFRYFVGKPIDPGKLRSALARGSAANPGDQVQITNIEFREKEIIVSINGGTKKHYNWRQHVQLSMPGVPMTTTTPTNAAPSQNGADLVLDFGGRVPDLTPDQLKNDLSPFLSFSSAHSSAVNWVDTLPPEFQKAIKDHTAIVGMNHDMVLAAVGRPDQKVREYDDNGRENEDWIYGHPPEKTTLVTFLGDKVIRVKSY